jgi:methyl-accepting chemotaxis protein
MANNVILSRNEHEANRFAAQIMMCTVGFIVLVYIMDVFNIFIVPLLTMTIAMAIAAVLLFIPAIIVFILKQQGWWVKYVTVTAAALMVSSLNIFLTYHIIIIYPFTIAIASLFFSRRLSWYAVIISISTLSVSQFLQLNVEGVIDLNFKTHLDMVMFGIIPRGIELLALSVIFIILSKRTRKMLLNVIGAEDQKRLLKKMQAVTGKSYDVCNLLAGSVKELSEITKQTYISNQQIAEYSGRIASGSENSIKSLDEAANTTHNISKSLDKINQEGKVVADISTHVENLTEKNREIIHQAVNEMQAIAEVTQESRKIINSMKERSSEIERIIEIITEISEQTNLLSLNAAIESARAGESGKGFAVVASEIGILAEKSQKSAKSISELIKEVLNDTYKGVESMDSASERVDNGIRVINEALESFKEVSSAGKEMNLKVHAVYEISKEAAENGSAIVNIVKNIIDINYKSLEELKTIASESKEQLGSMQKVEASVNSIEVMAGELLEVVKKA